MKISFSRVTSLFYTICMTMTKLNSEQLDNIKNKGCFRSDKAVVSIGTDTNYFKLGKFYHVGNDSMRHHYDDRCEKIKNTHHNIQSDLTNFASDIGIINSMASFVKTFYIKDNKRPDYSRFSGSTFNFSRWEDMVEGQRYHWDTVKMWHGSNMNTIPSYNKKKYDKYRENMDEINNGVTILPQNLSKVIRCMMFWLTMLLINMVLLISVILWFVLFTILYVLMVLYELVMLVGSIICRILYNIVIHVGAIGLYFLCWVGKMLVFLLKPIVLILALGVYLVKRAYYAIMYGIIWTFGTVPDTDCIDRAIHSMDNTSVNKVWDQVYLITKEEYDNYCNVDGVGINCCC